MESGFSSPRHDGFPAGLRVLVVDDDPTWLKILEKMLKKCSYEVISILQRDGCLLKYGPARISSADEFPARDGLWKPYKH
ncbi:hypothetical protein SAY87_028838 [Trapa incisa]|uniref:Response regulatory domain-containing protein n=1 Tax=Trapa incisa TaxID=236973 RepID=A0AAN7KYJ6_9MYRT|nr:hypothetical protein SAY87_028838 [Trapa incisa]